jgi:hypothetical protein
MNYCKEDTEHNTIVSLITDEEVLYLISIFT